MPERKKNRSVEIVQTAFKQFLGNLREYNDKPGREKKHHEGRNFLSLHRRKMAEEVWRGHRPS
jgi:hypothetical protein